MRRSAPSRKITVRQHPPADISVNISGAGPCTDALGPRLEILRRRTPRYGPTIVHPADPVFRTRGGPGICMYLRGRKCTGICCRLTSSRPRIWSGGDRCGACSSPNPSGNRPVLVAVVDATIVRFAAAGPPPEPNDAPLSTSALHDRCLQVSPQTRHRPGAAQLHPDGVEQPGEDIPAIVDISHDALTPH